VILVCEVPHWQQIKLRLKKLLIQERKKERKKVGQLSALVWTEGLLSYMNVTQTQIHHKKESTICNSKANCVILLLTCILSAILSYLYWPLYLKRCCLKVTVFQKLCFQLPLKNSPFYFRGMKSGYWLLQCFWRFFLWLFILFWWTWTHSYQILINGCI